MRFIFLGILVCSVFGLSVAQNSAQVPDVTISVPEVTPAGLPFTLSIQATKPLSYTVKYAGLELSETAQTYTLSLLASEGIQPIEVIAKDGGAESSYKYEVNGLAPLKPTISFPETVKAGEAFSAVVSWANDGLQPVSIGAYFKNEVTPFFKVGSQVVLLAVVPLGTVSGPLAVQVVMADEYGRTVTLNKDIMVSPDDRPVEDLNLSAGTFSVVTAEAQERERVALSEAYASSIEQAAPLWREPFIMPIEGRFTSGYGSPRRYVAGGNISYHHGTDIAAPQGTPILATNIGRVLVANYFPIKGGLTVIDHGASVFSFYFHQSKLLVQKGEMVERGQIIGEVGSTGLSTGPHLHWEMRVDGEPSSPLSWADKVYP